MWCSGDSTKKFAKYIPCSEVQAVGKKVIWLLGFGVGALLGQTSMLEVKREFYFPSWVSLLKLVLFTDSSDSSKEDAVSRFKVAGAVVVFERRWGHWKWEMGKGCSLSPTPCRSPGGSYNGAEPAMGPELLGLAGDRNALSQTEGAWALLSGHQQISANLCRGCAGASVSRHRGGASVCSLLSIELGNAPVCQAVRLVVSCHPVWFYR